MYDAYVCICVCYGAELHLVLCAHHGLLLKYSASRPALPPADNTAQTAPKFFKGASKPIHMMKIMGWKSGEGLGRSSDGNLKPLESVTRAAVCVYVRFFSREWCAFVWLTIRVAAHRERLLPANVDRTRAFTGYCLLLRGMHVECRSWLMRDRRLHFCFSSARSLLS